MVSGDQGECGVPDDRAALYRQAEHYFRRGGATEPNVVLLRQGGQPMVLKDYGAADGAFARWLGPLLIRREAQALQRLQAIQGIPRLIQRVDRRALLMAYVDARPWSRQRPAAESYDLLDELVTAMHARGVAHCDLRAPSNILVDDEGRPYLVDFVARVHRGAPWNLVWNAVFAAFCRADRNALAKLKVRYAPALASARERRAARHSHPVDRGFRALGAAIRKLTRHFVNRP